MKGLKQLILIFAAYCVCVSGKYTYIAGYEPQSEVVQHSRIDLDVREIIAYLPALNGGGVGDCADSKCLWESTYRNVTFDAMAIWKNGKNSLKTSSIRSIAGFASGAETKSSGNDMDTDVDYKDNSYISVMNDYWSSKGLNKYKWGYEIIDAAFNGLTVGDIDMSAVGDDFRREVVQKGIVYLNVYPYVIWEMQDAINDCNTGKIDLNDNSVHAWDEAVAFYTGSLEGESQGGADGLDSCTNSSNCQLQFMLADKRCKNFGTCTADYDNDNFAGYSKVNRDIFSLFTTGRDQILGAYHTAKCPDTDDVMDEIAGRMLIPFIQGVQRYLYKTAVPNTPDSKQAGELFAFASAVLPFIHKANPETAEMLYNRAWKLDYSEDDWKDIKYAIERTYPKLGAGAGEGVVTCLEVGELTESDDVKSEACVDPAESEEVSVPGWFIGLIVALAILPIATVVFACIIREKYSKALPLLEKQAGATEMV